MAEKGLDYYLENPDELPEDYSIDQIEALVNGTEIPAVVGEAEAQSEEESATDGTEAEAEPAKEEAPEEAPIQSKDGKHTIPYAVLSKEREQRRAAEAAIQDLQGRLTALEKGDTSETQSVAAVVSDDELSTLREDFPALAGTLEKLIGKIGTLETQLSTERNRFDQKEAQGVQMTVQESIDANPTLSHWQSADTKMFEAAIRFDDALKLDPENNDLSLSERFAKVVLAVEAIHGKTNIPGAEAKDETPSKQDIADKVKKAAEKAGDVKPKTLSDIPGGTPPRSSESADVENMSTAQIDRLMAKMSPDQMAEFLSKFG